MYIISSIYLVRYSLFPIDYRESHSIGIICVRSKLHEVEEQTVHKRIETRQYVVEETQYLYIDPSHEFFLILLTNCFSKP